MKDNMANLSSRPAAYYKSRREDMLKYIPRHTKKTLEFGCGFGEFSALLKERFDTESWAVEINNQAAEKAARKLDRVINADALESLDKIPDNYFDCIIFFDVLEHMADPYSLLCSVKTNLVEKGVVIA